MCILYVCLDVYSSVDIWTNANTIVMHMGVPSVVLVSRREKLELFSFSHEKSIFSYVCSVVEYVHMSAGTHGGQERASCFLELELQASEPSNVSAGNTAQVPE